MDHFPAQHLKRNSCDTSSVDFPQSQELFSDQEHADDNTEGDIVTIPHQSDNSNHSDNSHLFQDEVVSAPTRTKRTRGYKKLIPPATQKTDTSESSDYEPPPRKFTLQEIFDNHFRKKRNRSKEKKKKKKKKGPPKVRISKPFYSAPLEQRKRRLRHCGIRFPFAPKKHLSLKLCFAYEQYVLGGFLNYVKNLKYENHLQKALKKMEVGEQLEEENFETRKFKYLDDEEPLSPISESGKSDELETEYSDATIVENGSFILDCRIPSKQQWKIKGKRSSADD